MRLSYSQYRTFIQCPRLYRHQVMNIPPPVKPSEYFSLYGRLIESFFRKYTNIYTKENIVLTDDKIAKILRDQWEYILAHSYVDWSEPWVRESSEDIYRSVLEDTLKNIKAFEFWKEARSEVSFEVLLKKSQDVLSCRMDFIWEKPNNEIEILDGKGTNKIDTNVDVEQLYYYALMYLLKAKRLPNKIGFLYYRYQLIKYVDFDMDAIMEFKDKLAIVKKTIKDTTEFVAKVGLSKQCKWCAYKYNCDAYNAKKAENASKKKIIDVPYEGEIFDL